MVDYGNTSNLLLVYVFIYIVEVASLCPNFKGTRREKEDLNVLCHFCLLTTFKLVRIFTVFLLCVLALNKEKRLIK